jgi:hypothetical protein
MKIIDCEQRSVEWFEARLGIPTASTTWKLITRTGKRRTGKAPEAYLNSLLAERLTRKPTFVRPTDAMERGTAMEAEARAWFEREKELTVQQIGFALSDDGSFGCSPDGFFGTGGLEIKCPGLPVFMEIATALELPEAHFIQVQTCMDVFGVDHWFYVAYTDVRGLRPVCLRVWRDDKLCGQLRECLQETAKELDRREELMRKMGHGVPKDTPIDMSDFERDLTSGEIEALDETNPESI